MIYRKSRYRAKYGTAAGTAAIGLSAEVSMWSATQSPLLVSYATAASS